MRGVHLMSLLLYAVVVHAVPWWSDIGAAHGVRAVPLTLAELAGESGRQETEDGGRFPWRFLRQSGDTGSDIQLRSSKVPSFSVLDEDQDDTITSTEWTNYVKKLRVMAVAIIPTTSDPVAKMFLHDIVSFHYDNLHSCIRDRLAQSNSTEFGEISVDIQLHCYVRFRYSLFAGPPPFEMIAKKQTTMSSHDAELWFTHQVDIAHRDLADKRVFSLTEEDEKHLEGLVLCVYQELDPWGDLVLDRNAFYGALMSIMRCAEANKLKNYE